MRAAVLGPAALVWSVYSTSAGARMASPRASLESPASVRLCISVPRSVPALALLSEGVIRGVSLAQQRFQNRFTQAGVRLEPPLVLDYGAQTGPSDPNRALQTAERCLAAPDAVAYIGPINSYAALPAEPALNRGGMLTISPATTLSALTDPQLRETQEPATAAHELPYVTYYRVLGPDAIQGLGGATFLHKHLRAGTFYLIDDRTVYGVNIVQSLRNQMQKLGIQRVGVAHPDTSSPGTTERNAATVADQVVSVAPDVVYCGCGLSEIAASLARALYQRGFKGAFLGPDALMFGAWPQLAGPLIKAYATTPGVDSAHASAWFVKRYRAHFGAAPQFYDAQAYDAASIALQAIYAAAVHRQLGGSKFAVRSLITGYAARICYHGATGTTTFDRNGDTSNRIVSVFSAPHGIWRFAGTVRIGNVPTCH